MLAALCQLLGSLLAPLLVWNPLNPRLMLIQLMTLHSLHVFCSPSYWSETELSTRNPNLIFIFMPYLYWCVIIINKCVSQLQVSFFCHLLQYHREGTHQPAAKTQNKKQNTISTLCIFCLSCCPSLPKYTLFFAKDTLLLYLF